MATRSETPLAGKHVLVVGASSGMGRSVAIEAARAGASLTLMGRDETRLRAVAEEAGGGVIARLDLLDTPGIEAALRERRKVDHLVITAGTFGTARLAQSEPDDWRRVLEERIIGPLALIKALGPDLTGSVTIFTGSIVRRPSIGSVLATAALGGVEAAVRALALELAPVRANAVSPGMIDTPMLDRVLKESKGDVARAMAEKLPARCIGTPEDAASAAMFLMTNPFITAATIELDGGATYV